MSVVAAPFAWYGGKARLAPAIVRLLPRHDTYVEPFGGAGAVLVAKSRATLEVYNDIDSGLVTFFRVLRERPVELERALRLTPYAREEFRHACAVWETTDEDLERARLWYVRCRQAFAASAATVGWAFEVDGAQRGGTRAGSFATSVEHLARFAERFRAVQVDQIDWRACIHRYDQGGVCFYLDPPYHPDTRGRGRHSTYRHELTAQDHEDLVAAAIKIRGSVLISGYAHTSYMPLEDAGFERHEFAHHSTASRDLSGRGDRTEVLWRRLEHGTQQQLQLLGVAGSK